MWFLRRRGAEAVDEAQKALVEAKQALSDILDRDKEVAELSEASREMRERNHFAEALDELLRRRRRPLRD